MLHQDRIEHLGVLEGLAHDRGVGHAGPIVGERDHSPIIAARFEGRDASELARELKKRRVLVSARHGHVRVSVHFYNLEEDLDCLESALGAIL